MHHADLPVGTDAQAAYLHALEADLQLARALQQALLPQQYPAFPAAAAPEESALRFYHCYQAAATLSGDFFSVQPLSDSCAGIFICDVMGHGVRPAMFTAMLRSLIEELAPLAGDPGQFLSTINDRLISLLQRARMTFFATAFYMIADATTGTVKYANAGHPVPLVMQRSRGNVMPLPHGACSGPALGVFEEAEYPVAECVLAVEDVIVLFTDGLVEAKGGNGHQAPTGENEDLQEGKLQEEDLQEEDLQEYGDAEEYGEERLQAALKNYLQLPTQGLLDTIISEQQQFCGTGELEDDLCLLAMEVCKIGEIAPKLRDDVTGLFNLRYLQESLVREVHRAQRNGYPLSIVILAFEEFEDWSKADQEAGTLLLRQVGDLLLHRTRGSDIACHTNNGKFILVLPEASLENSIRKAEQLLQAMQQIGSAVSSQRCAPQPCDPLCVSGGVAAYPEHGTTGEAVIEAASARLEAVSIT